MSSTNKPANSATLSAKSILLNLDFDKVETDRKLKLLGQMCRAMLALIILAIPTYAVLSWINGSFQTVIGLGILLLYVPIYLFAIRLCRIGYYNLVSWLLIGLFLIILCHTYWIFGTTAPLVVAFIVPIVLACILLKTPQAVSITAFSLAFTTGIYLSQHLFKFYTPVITITTEQNIILSIGCAVIIFIGITTFLLATIQSQTRMAREQNERLRVAYQEIETRQRVSEEFSREVLSLTTELTTTTNQQAVGSREQVAAVTEVTTSLEELSETANQIASSASAAAKAANQTVELASVVKEASALAQETTDRGNEAVDQAVASVERVRNRIELLGQRLLHLTEQTRKVGSIIDIIEEIADETHLLALNASIEAAGGTMVGEAMTQVVAVTAKSSRAERFGVIAQEVKNLSDRSRESTEEVRQAITEMQGAVAAAVLVAEEGKKETSAALSRSQIAGTVIDNLSTVIENSSSRAQAILNAAEEVRTRCDEISVATGQQRSANQQILVTMRGVSQISEQNAGAISQLSDTAYRVNNQVGALNRVLDTSTQAPNVVTLLTGQEINLN